MPGTGYQRTRGEICGGGSDRIVRGWEERESFERSVLLFTLI